MGVVQKWREIEKVNERVLVCVVFKELEGNLFLWFGQLHSFNSIPMVIPGKHCFRLKL